MIDVPPPLPPRLAKTVQRNLALIGEPPVAGNARLVGPLQHCRGLSGDFLRNVENLPHIGWRGPVLQDDVAIATVSIGKGRRPGLSVRGAEAGAAFAAAIDAAVQRVPGKSRACIRLVTLSDLAIRAVWIRLPRHSLWVPMRIGSERLEPEVIGTRTFKDQVRKQARAVAQTPAAARRGAALAKNGGLQPGGHAGTVRYNQKLIPLAKFEKLGGDRRRKGTRTS